MLSDATKPNDRLRALQQSADGFALAELDLRLRGPGAIYGHSQHGVLDLRLVQLSDTTLISEAREAAKACMTRVEELLQYEALHQRIAALQAVRNLN